VLLHLLLYRRPARFDPFAVWYYAFADQFRLRRVG